MGITVELPEELACELQPLTKDLPKIIQLGIREWQAQGSGYAGLASVLEALAGLPTPEEVLQLRPAAALEDRIETLLEKSKDGSLSEAEQQEWQHYAYVEHLVRLAKAKAALKLQGK